MSFSLRKASELVKITTPLRVTHNNGAPLKTDASSYDFASKM